MRAISSAARRAVQRACHHIVYAHRGDVIIRLGNTRPTTIRWESRESGPFGNQSRTIFATAASQPTIYALSTAPGRAAIAVIRISGPACLDIYRQLCPNTTLPKPKFATLRTLYAPHVKATQDSVLDPGALVLYFKGPSSVTGEDVLELHVHGGSAIVKAVLAAIPQCDESGQGGICYAEAGEFTRRAFLNSRLDLTQVEALGDTLAASTEQQRKLAVRGTNGQLSRQYETWRQALLYARGELEALIDFSEDQHFDESPNELCASVAAQVSRLLIRLRVYQQNAVRGELLRHGIAISLLGAPNAGKSSLLNRIVGREAAIVSSEAGTTRDVVEVGIDIGGFFCRLGDTAGLRKADRIYHSHDVSSSQIGEVESEGMRRAKARAADSDVVVVVVSVETAEGFEGPVGLRLDTEVVATANQLAAEGINIIVVLNKADMTVSAETIEMARAEILKAFVGLRPDRLAVISCKDATSPSDANLSEVSDAGHIQAFLSILIQQFADMTSARGVDGESDSESSVWQESIGASERHRLLLEETISRLEAFMHEVSAHSPELSANTTTTSEAFVGAVAHLNSQSHFIAAEADGEDLDLVVSAEHLRGAANCLAKITGRGNAGDVEDVLGVVFEKFCVGK